MTGTPETSIRKRRHRSVVRRHSHLFTFNNIAIAFFLTACIGLYYPQTLPIVWAGYLMIAAAIGVSIVRNRSLPPHSGPFLCFAGGFLLWAFMSVTWAYNDVFAAESVKYLARYMLLGFALLLVVRTRTQFRVALFWLSIASVVYALFYLQFIDLTKLASARMASTLKSNIDGLPNYNVVAMYLSFGALYFIYRLMVQKKFTGVQFVFFALLIVLSVGIIFLFGSRKSILAIVIGFCLFFMVHASGKRRLQLVLLIVIALSILLSVIPTEYLLYTMDRMMRLTGNSGALERADQLRLLFLEKGAIYIGESPIIGHGYYNFQELFNRDTGIPLYAHNNFVEALTDLGVVGVILYYGVYFLIYRNIWLTWKVNPMRYFVVIITSLILFNGFFIVYMTDSFIWCLLAMLYVGSIGFPQDRVELREEGRREQDLRRRKMAALARRRERRRRQWTVPGEGTAR